MSVRPSRETVVLLIFSVGIVAAVWPFLPRADLPGYFDFADRREWLGVPNFNDVASNLAYLLISFVGFAKARVWPERIRSIAYLLAVTAAATFAGSTYFHLEPSVGTVFWDRLPIALAFSCLVALLLADRFSRRAGMVALATLGPIGVISLIGWHLGWMDLRPYILLQYGSLLLIPFVLWRRSRGHLQNKKLWIALALYIAAKVFEMTDAAVFSATGVVSGHTIKHLLSALAIWEIFRANAVPAPLPYSSPR